VLGVASGLCALAGDPAWLVAAPALGEKTVLCASTGVATLLWLASVHMRQSPNR
jgi:hypothetical protein